MLFEIFTERNDNALLNRDGDCGESYNTLMRLARNDPTLSGAWEQAKDGTHGMFVRDGLLFHRDEFEGKSCKEIVLPSKWWRSALELAHDTPCGGHISQRKTKQRTRNAFFWPTMGSRCQKILSDMSHVSRRFHENR